MVFIRGRRRWSRILSSYDSNSDNESDISLSENSDFKYIRHYRSESQLIENSYLIRVRFGSLIVKNIFNKSYLDRIFELILWLKEDEEFFKLNDIKRNRYENWNRKCANEEISYLYFKWLNNVSTDNILYSYYNNHYIREYNDLNSKILLINKENKCEICNCNLKPRWNNRNKYASSFYICCSECRKLLFKEIFILLIKKYGLLFSIFIIEFLIDRNHEGKKIF